MRKEVYSKDLTGKKILTETSNKVSPLSQKKADFFSITAIILPIVFMGDSLELFLECLEAAIIYKRNNMATIFHKPYDRLTGFEMRDIFKNNRLNSKDIDILKISYPLELQWCLLSANWLKVKITPLFFSKTIDLI